MSRFGDENFKSEIYENLNWIISEEPFEQINFLHMTITELVTNGLEYINDYVAECIEKYSISHREAVEYLSEIYSSIVSWDLIEED